MQLRPLGLVERNEELRFETLREAAQTLERAASRRCHAHDLPPPVGGVALPFDEPLLLELVEQADELALVVAERSGDRALRLARAFVQHRENRMVVGMEPELVVGRERALLG